MNRAMELRCAELRCARPLAAICCCLFAGVASTAWGYTTDSPDVVAMADRAVWYIETNFGPGPMDDELGGVCICALACYSHTGDAEHWIVRKAIARIREDARNGFKQGAHENYSLGIALILLGTLDAQAHQDEVHSLLKEIYKRQHRSGAWTYPGDPLGDTSQTQYACLGMWMAHRQGIAIDQTVLERACNWLLRTQGPDGSFGYKPIDPGRFDARLAQQRDTFSMGTAGTGTLYVCGELLGFIDDPLARQILDELPLVFRPVTIDGSISKTVDAARWDSAVRDGNNWLNRARVENTNAQQQYYYLYTVERYWAFRELATSTHSKEPAWYNRGVDYLKRKQSTDGSWHAGDTQSAAIDTAFATLFLLRSSTKIVQQLRPREGTARGGRDLPSDVSNVGMDSDGRVVPTDSLPVEEIVAQLSDSDAGVIDDSLYVPEKFELPEDSEKRLQLLAWLRRSVINGSFKVRLAATRTLGSRRDVESVPVLIYALSDPDHRVVRAARDALRFVSRQPDGFGLEVNERPEQATLKRAQVDWANWLLTVQPDAELIQ